MDTDETITPAAEPATPLPTARVLRARYRNLDARGRGIECYRRVVDVETRTSRWATEAGIVTSDDWCPRGVRASERRCATRVEVPVGALIIDIVRDVGSGSAKARYQCALVVAEGKDPLVYEADDRCPYRHVGVKKRGASYVHVLERRADRERIEIGE